MRSAGSRGDRLAGGSHAEIVEWLPRGLSPVDAARAGIVARVHRGEGGRRSALADAAALSAVDHPHVASMLGVDDDGASVAILMPRLSTMTAREWLRARGPVPAGEAVTLLVPLLRALLHLERRGFDGSVDLASLVDLDDVLFDGRGTPVLSRLRLAPSSGPSRLARPEGGAAGAARRLVREARAALDDATGREARPRTLDDLLARAETPSIDELIEAVFELAAPVPLTLVGAESRRGGITPDTDRPTHESWRDRVTAIRRRIRAAVVEVRPKVWVTSGIIAVSALTGVVLASSGGPGERPVATDSRPHHAESNRSAPPTSTVPTADAPTPVRSAADHEESALAGTPERAFPVLLRLRAACLRALDEDCVHGVDEDGSPALAGDVAAIDDPDLLRDLPVELSAGGVVNRLGGAVLFRATNGRDDKPASVLVTRTEAGWRLRSVVTDPPG